MPNLQPEQIAREEIDRMLTDAGWLIQDVETSNITAGLGVAIREFPLKSGHGFADYLLYVDGKAAGVIEAKKEGSTLSGVEIQSEKYSKGLPGELPAWSRPLPFSYQSTGIETRFTNSLEPDARSRNVFSFHKPETLFEWLESSLKPTSDGSPSILAEETASYGHLDTLRSRLRQMPPLIEEGLWPAQIRAINNLEKSLADGRPRSLIQMATGSGKTFTAVSSIYRLIRFAKARRILFLVDRANLGRQTLKEFKQYSSPYNNLKFNEEYIVQHLQSNKLDRPAKVCITTIQRLYSMLKGEEISEELEDESLFDHTELYKEPPPVEYNPNISIETFDFIITDECHRSIYGLWRQVLEYFDSFLIGLTATPNKQTFGFFNQNLVMEYPHEEAVADGVNVNYDVYRIRTAITEGGSNVNSGFYVDKRDRETREVRWEQLDEELTYEANQLDRDIVATDQIRTVIRTFRDKLFTEIFPDRKEVPKTLVFAKDDSHAEDIVGIMREEFGKGNDFAQKITYKTTGRRPEDLIAEFRNSYFPRIAVTVDMIATGTDIKPVEIVLFMRTIRSRSFFEQMKGRGVRIINDTDLQAVTPDAKSKYHFIIVDAVGVCEQDRTDSKPMEKKRSVSLEKLLQAVAFGNREPDVISSIAGRLARIGRKLTQEEDTEVLAISGSSTLKELSGSLVKSINPDSHIEKAKTDNPGTAEPSPEQVKSAARGIMDEAVRPLMNPDLRNKIIELNKKNEQTIDHVSQDTVTEAAFSAEALEKARGLVQSFEKFIEDNRDEITALQLLFSKPYKARLRFEDIKELAEQIEKPPHNYKIDSLWRAYGELEKSKVRGRNTAHIMTDLVSLVRYAMHQENELIPYPERVNTNFAAWIKEQESRGKHFTEEQTHWLEMIRDHIAANLTIETDAFDYAPFIQEGGLGRVHQIFGDELDTIINDLNEALAA